MQPDSAANARGVPAQNLRRKRLLQIVCLVVLLPCFGMAAYWQWSAFHILGRHTSRVQALTFDPDGKTLRSDCSDLNRPEIAGIIWDPATGQEQGSFPGGKRVTLSSDGRFVARYDEANQAIDVWDVELGMQRITLPNTHAELWRMAISPDGAVLASAGCDLKRGAARVTDTEPGEIRLWDLVSGEKIREFGSWESQVSGLSFAPDGKRLASCSWDGSIQLWNVANGREVTAFQKKKEEGGAAVNAVAFSPDGRYLAAAGQQGILVWDAATKELLATLVWGGYGPPLCLTFSPDSQFLAAGGTYASWHYLLRGCRVVVWEAETLQKRADLKGRLDADTVWCVAFSPDGSRLAIGTAFGYVGMAEGKW